MPLVPESLHGTHATLLPAECVTLVLASGEERLRGVMVYIDREGGLVHVLDHEGETHLYTCPIDRVIIEWRHSSERGGERIASRGPHATG